MHPAAGRTVPNGRGPRSAYPPRAAQRDARALVPPSPWACRAHAAAPARAYCSWPRPLPPPVDTHDLAGRLAADDGVNMIGPGLQGIALLRRKVMPLVNPNDAGEGFAF